MAQSLQSDLNCWKAYSHELLKMGERKRSYMFPTSWSCIICDYKEIGSLPVYQCREGQLVCSSCSQSGRKCTTCLSPVEEILEAKWMTCKYGEVNCNVVGDFTDAEWTEHEKSCDFVPINCPMPRCSRAGIKLSLKDHLRIKHNISTVVDLQGKDRPLKEFELKNFTNLVVLRDPESDTFYVLNQESMMLGDTLRLTSESCKRSYDLKVSIGEDAKYSFTGECTTSWRQGGMLLIPEGLADNEDVKKRCTIELSGDDGLLSFTEILAERFRGVLANGLDINEMQD